MNKPSDVFCQKKKIEVQDLSPKSFKNKNDSGSEVEIYCVFNARGPVRERRDIVFSKGEKDIILGNRKLTDESINLAHNIFHKSHPHINGFQDTHQVEIRGWGVIPHQTNYIQILQWCHQ